MAASPEAILKDLKNNTYAPVYFLQGEEAYYIDLISDYIAGNALDESAKSFNQTILYGKDVDISAILNHAKRYPMMSERQVVIVKEAQEIQNFAKQDSQKILEQYLKNPLPSTILVFCHKYKVLDGRKSIAKVLDQYAVVVTSKAIYDNQVPDWIQRYISEKGFAITEKAKQMLADNIGANLERLSNEIDKMTLNFQSGEKIDEAAVQKFVGISKDFNVFELQKALAVKDVVKSNRIVNYFAANPKSHPAIPVIALLYMFYSKLLIVHHTGDKSERALAGKLGVNPYFVKEYLIAARNYPLPKVIRNIRSLRKADMQCKGIDYANMQDGQILKELIFNLLH